MKVYWSRCGPRHGNFGDKITPMLLQQAGIPVEWAPPEHAELFGTGSVLEKVPQNFKGIIWTTGFMNDASRREFKRARVLGVRGRLTAERISRADDKSVMLGDAGLLCGELAPLARKRFKLGIIPHFVDADDSLVKRLASSSTDICVIDICAADTEVLRSIAHCEKIISSSLHGLIVAHSLGIPARWLELNHGAEIVSGFGFKYRDYYSAFDENASPLQLAETSNLDDVLRALNKPAPRKIETVKANLRRTLAEIKAGIRPLSDEELAAKKEAAEEWQRRANELRTILAATIPSESAFIIADEDQLRSLFGGLNPVPFLERDGFYWGPPGTADEAIQELQRQLERGVAWLVLAWPAAWMLENFPALASFVERRFICRHSSVIAQVFEART